MVVDTSALIAFLTNEPVADRIGNALLADSALFISSATVIETGIVVETRRGEAAGRELDLLLHRLGITIVPVSVEQVALARAAYREFGKGVHRARLNFGDCFSYALAIDKNEPLLFVGEDFQHTDVLVAEY